MSTVNADRLPALRARFGQALSGRLDAHIERLSWDAERVAQHQRVALRALLGAAVERSPFHARRLVGIDPRRFELDQLAELPVMTKNQMMANFDELPTDRRLTRARVEAQLAASIHEPTLLDEKYLCLASGGSSGLRGVFVQTVDEYAEFTATILRRLMARVAAAGGPPPEGLTVGIVAASAPIHSSGFAAAVAQGYPVRAISAPATLPLPELVSRLNDRPPPVLLAHASALVLLAGEQRAGRLRIAPGAITAMSELLTDEDRVTIREAFGVSPIDQFVSTEGLVGHTEPGGAVFTFATDACIVELVDADNHPVPDGVPSAKVLLTNLHNFSQPLIRYELTDRFIATASLGSPYLRAAVEGRADDAFNFGSVVIDPLMIRTVMVRNPAVLEYQVRQTTDGIDVSVVVGGELDRHARAGSLGHSLRSAGLVAARVRVHEVAEIARHPETGKSRRFIPGRL